MELERLEKYLDETSQIIEDAKVALANEGTAAKYAATARDHFELLRKVLNRVDESVPMMEDFPEIPA